MNRLASTSTTLVKRMPTVGLRFSHGESNVVCPLPFFSPTFHLSRFYVGGIDDVCVGTKLMMFMLD